MEYAGHTRKVCLALRIGHEWKQELELGREQQELPEQIVGRSTRVL